MEKKTLNIDLQLKIGYFFAFAGLSTFFWYYLVIIIIASITQPEERQFILITALLWLLVKTLQLFFLGTARSFKTRPNKHQFQVTQIFLFLYVFAFVGVFSYSATHGLEIFDWIVNIGEIFLLLNMMAIYYEFRRPDVAEIVMSNERGMEAEKEKTKTIKQKQRIEGQFIVFDPSLHLETIENPHEQLDPWVSKNNHLNYYAEVNPYDTMYEKDLENYRNQFKSAQASTHQKAIEDYKGVKNFVIGWVGLILIGNIYPLIGTINVFQEGNAGFWQYFHVIVVLIFTLPFLIGYIIVNKKGIDHSPKTPGKIKSIQRPIVQFYESESELIIVKVELGNLTENKFKKSDIIGIRSNEGSDRIKRPKTTWDGRPVRGHYYANVPYNELVLQYFDDDLVEQHQILKLDSETFEILNTSINKLREAFKADFGRDKSRFRGPSFKVCGACNEIALATDKFCDDCGILLR